jgi:fructokinase
MLTPPKHFDQVPANPASGARTVVGLGEALWDLLPSGRHIGGAPLNFAYISSLLGERAIIASRIGSDKAGDDLFRELSSRDIDTTYIQRDEALPTGTVGVTVSSDGQPSYEIRQPVSWDALEWLSEWEELASRADAVCFGTLAQRSERSRNTIAAFLRSTRRNCVRVFDVNLRAPFFSRELVVDSIRLATIVKLNEEEFDEVTAMVGLPKRSRAESLQTFARTFNLELVCLTMGGNGSLLATPDQTLEHPGFPITVVDTVGAGDAFTAAVAHCWVSRLGLDVTSTVANRWAGWVASQSGAMPVIDEVLRRQMLP